MQTLLITISIAFGVMILGLLIWLMSSSFSGRREVAGQAAKIDVLQQQLEALRAAHEKAGENLQQSLQAGQSHLFDNFKHTREILDRLHSQIGQLKGASQHMMEVGADVRKLQEILASPKLRGQLGEWSLEKLLVNVMPGQSYELQHTFRDGKIVDALVHMQGFSVSIDAKFPLPGFTRLQSVENDAERNRLRRQFQKDVMIHIDKIASAYIRPEEGTLDFALMYVPAENVYYETVVRYEGDAQDLLPYCLERKVIPVSPNLLYAYLMTVAMGLHGMHIEEQAAEIRQNLGKLSHDMSSFTTCWETLGTHLRNAAGKYDEGQRRLDRFVMQLEQIEVEPGGVSQGVAHEDR